MRYKIFVLNEIKEDVTWQGKEDYATREKAENKIKKSYKRKTTKIAELPDKIGIGLKLYSSGDRIFGTIIPQGEFIYGEIVREDEYFWWVKRFDGEELFFLKENFEMKFVTNTFYIKE